MIKKQVVALFAFLASALVGGMAMALNLKNHHVIRQSHCSL
jgi:hypothetical protein